MPASHGRAPVWDAAVRVLHWALAALVAFNLLRDDGDLVHRVAGYAAVGVVLARLAWAGLREPTQLRLSPSATLAYLRELVRGRAPRSAGHNPLGLWMVWLLWTLVLLLGLTGWMSRWDMFWGDERLHDLHAWLADALMVAVIVHLIGVSAMSWLWKENLPASMITGGRRPD
ncbi:MAG TPA: cytochrome b/b6 domain-containing protein [Burkholderiaceae bacterium]|jgi:cytochrome b|nr:cytochrome b/b6 domain-containing protein [Burkholderiaceae bacterium]